MKRTANFISFTHPKRPARRLEFVREGKKGLHATGGVWGEKDWFESLRPDAIAFMAVLCERVEQYKREGFQIDRVQIYEPAFAAALGFPMTERPKALATEKKREKDSGRASGSALLSAAPPKTVKEMDKRIREIKAALLRPLGSALRRQIRAQLDEIYDALVAIAASGSADARQACKVLPLGLRPKEAKEAKKKGKVMRVISR